MGLCNEKESVEVKKPDSVESNIINESNTVNESNQNNDIAKNTQQEDKNSNKDLAGTVKETNKSLDSEAEVLVVTLSRASSFDMNSSNYIYTLSEKINIPNSYHEESSENNSKDNNLAAAASGLKKS